jgi:hypothetical protein
VHLLLSIPPKFSIANTVGFVKGKSAIQIHRKFLGRQRNFTGFHFWARCYCVSTVGLDEARAYIRDQEDEEKRQELLPLGGLQSGFNPIATQTGSVAPFTTPKARRARRIERSPAGDGHFGAITSMVSFASRPIHVASNVAVPTATESMVPVASIVATSGF